MRPVTWLVAGYIAFESLLASRRQIRDPGQDLLGPPPRTADRTGEVVDRARAQGQEERQPVGAKVPLSKPLKTRRGLAGSKG